MLVVLWIQFGLSALHVAVMEGRGEEVDMLNNIGVDFDCKSKVRCSRFLEMNGYWR